MHYLIDGHNLIPHLPGLSLRDPDDEARLAELVLAFCRAGRHRAEVFFDGAPPGQAGRRTFGGLVTLVFVRRGQTADQAIQRRLHSLGRAARNFTVVSSDRQVQAAARSAGARILDAVTFARRLQAHRAPMPSAPEKPAGLAPDDVDEWLRLFGQPPEETT